MRRRRLPRELAGPWNAFLAVVEPVERAKGALMEAVPTARAAGRPLAEALAEFEEGLREGERRMPGWRHPRTEGDWRACRDGVAAALRRAEDLRLSAPDLGFEELLGTVGDLIAPLEAFRVAAERFRSLRTTDR